MASYDSPQGHNAAAFTLSSLSISLAQPLTRRFKLPKRLTSSCSSADGSPPSGAPRTTTARPSSTPSPRPGRKQLAEDAAYWQRLARRHGPRPGHVRVKRGEQMMESFVRETLNRFGAFFRKHTLDRGSGGGDGRPPRDGHRRESAARPASARSPPAGAAFASAESSRRKSGTASRAGLPWLDVLTAGLAVTLSARCDATAGSRLLPF